MEPSELTRTVKTLTRDKDAALVGIAPVERFDPKRCMSRTEANHAEPVRGDGLRVCPLPERLRQL